MKSKIKLTANDKHGGFILVKPALPSGVSAVGPPDDIACAIAKTIDDKKAAEKQLKETIRYNCQMEKGKGLFFSSVPWSKNWQGIIFETFQKLNIRNKPLSHYDLIKYVKRL